MKFSRTKTLILTNNKGGVGKTTLTFNLSAKLAEKGYKVLMIDVDEQCNLSSFALGDYFEKNLFSYEVKNIYDMLKGIIVGGSDIDLDIKLEKIRENLYLLPGSNKISEYENGLISAYGEAAQGSERGYFVTSAIYRYLNAVGLRDEFDFIILDTGPNLNLLNRVVLLSINYFITPMMPDAFSVQGIENIGIKFEEWKDNWKKTGVALARDKNIASKMIMSGEGLFIGYIINSYNKYAGRPVKNNLDWIDKIPDYVKIFLSERHCKNGLVEKSYSVPIVIMKDFGSLAPAAQFLSKSIFELDTKIDGLDHPGTKESLDIAKKEIEQMTNNILKVFEKY